MGDVERFENLRARADRKILRKEVWFSAILPEFLQGVAAEGPSKRLETLRECFFFVFPRGRTVEVSELLYDMYDEGEIYEGYLPGESPGTRSTLFRGVDAREIKRMSRG